MRQKSKTQMHVHEFEKPTDIDPMMVTHLNEWLDQCETLTTSHVMTDAEIIQSVMQKEDSTPDSEVQDTEADHGSSDITVISVAGARFRTPIRLCSQPNNSLTI